MDREITAQIKANEENPEYYNHEQPDVECHGCGRLLSMTEVEHTEREPKGIMGIPRYYCKKCTKEQRIVERSVIKSAIKSLEKSREDIAEKWNILIDNNKEGKKKQNN